MSTPAIMRYFEYEHLQEPLRSVSKAFAGLAQVVVNEIPDGDERDAGLRKLLEAKDCIVRQALDLIPEPSQKPEEPTLDIDEDWMDFWNAFWAERPHLVPDMDDAEIDRLDLWLRERFAPPRSLRTSS